MKSIADLLIKEGYHKGEARGIAKGEAIGIAKGIADVINAMLARGVKLSDIAKFTGMDKKKIKELVKQ